MSHRYAGRNKGATKSGQTGCVDGAICKTLTYQKMGNQGRVSALGESLIQTPMFDVEQAKQTAPLLTPVVPLLRKFHCHPTLERYMLALFCVNECGKVQQKEP